MTVAVFVTVALTFFLFNIYTINSIKDFLKQETDAVANTLKSVSDIEEAAEFISADGESYYKIVIFDSDMKLQAQNTSEELNLDKRTGRQLSKAKKDGANFFFASSYKKVPAINYAVRVENSQIEGGYLMLMCSVDVIYNTGPYFLIVIIAALIWAGVILASYFALTLNMKFATIPFEKT